MKNIMPQEIEVWYLIPALRRELARIFIEDYNLSQKKTAETLGMTSAAISQYVNSKRGKGIKFSDIELEKIKKSAKKIIDKKETLMKELYGLCDLLRKSKTICEIHKSQDGSISGICDICFK